MKDISVYSDDTIFLSLLTSELRRIGKNVGGIGDDCILLILDADCENSCAKAETPHTFTLGVTRELSRHESEFDALIRRPVSMSELREKVSEILERREHSDFPSDEDEIILLTDRKTVLFNGKKILLTPNEFSLLEQLIANRGNVVSRSTINALLGGDGNTSDVYICMLRKKLTVNRRSPIVTLRGKGYVIY